MGNLESYLLSIPPAGNQRDELLKQMTQVVDQLEEFNKHLKGKPTTLQQYTYQSYEQEFKRIYSILLTMNPHDSALDPLLSRFGRARVVYSKIERPETYQQPLLENHT
jgi:hypothetical protein